MYIKLDLFVPDAKIISIYSYELCDEAGNEISNPAFDFLSRVNKTSPRDAEILVSQIKDTANKYGLLGRNERSNSRPRLDAFPSKSDQEGVKIIMRHRLFFWVLNPSTILMGGGCFKPSEFEGKVIKRYQDVLECENAADELSKIAIKLERLNAAGKICIDEDQFDINPDEIIPI